MSNMVQKIKYIILGVLIALSFCGFNVHASERIVLDLNSTDYESYAITTPGDYELSGVVQQQLFIKQGGTEDNPVRIFIPDTIEFQSRYVSSIGSDAPFISIGAECSGYIEIIGEGDTPVTIMNNSSANTLVFQATPNEIYLKVKNLVFDSVNENSLNCIHTAQATGNKNLVFEDVTFQNWSSTSSGFAVNLTSSKGALDATFTNCKFLNNSGTTGGGLLVAGNADNIAKATLINCEFAGNINNASGKTAGNTAGSLNVRKYADVTVIGGSITSGNITGTTSSGITAPGGLAIASSGTCTLEDAEIKENSGYGIYNAGTLTLKGSTTVTGNNASNIYLTEGNQVIVDDNWTGTAGISVSDSLVTNSGVQITTNQDSNFQDALKNTKIFSDNKDYTIEHADTNYLYITVHTHNWEYQAVDNVITLNCVSGGDCLYSNSDTKLILNADNAIYDGNTYSKVSIENNITDITSEVASDIIDKFALITSESYAARPGDLISDVSGVTDDSIVISSPVTLTYDDNCEDTVDNIPDYQSGYWHETFNISEKTPQREMYKFNTWNTQADGSGLSYEPKSTLEITENTTLYAIWAVEDSTFTVTIPKEIMLNKTDGGKGSGEYIADLTVKVQGKLKENEVLTVDIKSGETFELVNLTNEKITGNISKGNTSFNYELLKDGNIINTVHKLSVNLIPGEWTGILSFDIHLD